MAIYHVNQTFYLDLLVAYLDLYLIYLVSYLLVKLSRKRRKGEDEDKVEKDDRLEINHPKRYNADTPYECIKVLEA